MLSLPSGLVVSRSLLFRRWKHVLPLAKNIAEQKAELLEYDFHKMLVSPEPPIARNDRQFWHQTGTGTRAQKVFHGTVRIGFSMVMSATIRSYQSRESRTAGSWKRSPVLTSLQGGTKASMNPQFCFPCFDMIG